MSEQTNEAEEQTTPIADSETAPEQKEKVTFSEDQQAVIDKVGHQGRENVRAERQKTADLQRQLDDANAKIPKEQRPDVAAAGDVYDENYEQNRAQREAQIRTQAEFDARIKFDAEATQQAEFNQQQKQQQDFNDSVRNFNSTAVKFDIDQQQLSVMDQTIASYGGLSPTVGEYVLGDEQGMLIYQHFSNSPEDIAVVNSMNPIKASEFLTDIKAKQSALHTKKLSGAPDPASRIEGGGVDPEAGKYPFSDGATFE